jgi:hypothetical protein
MKISPYITGLILIFLNSCSDPSQKTSQTPITDSILQPEKNVYDLVKDHQILLMNYAKFKGQVDSLWGASSFLIDYNNKTYAVTAKHLIGPSGGIDPEIAPEEMSKYFISWSMFPRVPVTPIKDTVKIDQPKLNYDSLDKDILLLEVKNAGFNILPLKPKFILPVQGDTLYIIGCPYSEENCKQNIYEAKFISYESEQSMILCSALQKFEVRGFSGAPIVDKKGNVLGTIAAGWNEDSIQYVGATFIKEIKKIR